jgi:hypothetical protein
MNSQCFEVTHKYKEVTRTLAAAEKDLSSVAATFRRAQGPSKYCEARQTAAENNYLEHAEVCAICRGLGLP